MNEADLVEMRLNVLNMRLSVLEEYIAKKFPDSSKDLLAIMSAMYMGGGEEDDSKTS